MVFFFGFYGLQELPSVNSLSPMAPDGEDSSAWRVGEVFNLLLDLDFCTRVLEALKICGLYGGVP